MVTSAIKNISNLISSPEKATDDELSYLFQLSKKHQYAGICYVIIAKILRSQNRTGFDNILRSAALRINNRAYLFNIIQNSPKTESSPIVKPEIKTKEKKDFEPTEQKKEDENLLEQNIYSNLISNELIHEINNPEEPASLSPEIEKNPVDEKEEINEKTLMPFEFWLYKSPPINATKKERTVDEILKSLEDRKTSKDKKQFFSPSEAAKKSLIDEEEMYTETLAEIYIKQGNYPKAIKIYEQLMMSIPEKKLFFASRINYINQKTKL
jgi:hypothetical protein